MWKLTEPGRQLDANLIHLPPRTHVGTHTEADLDVLLLIVAGNGTVAGVNGPQKLSEGTLLWLPRGSSRSLTAEEKGLTYLTIHRRRPGLQIHHRDRRSAQQPQ